MSVQRSPRFRHVNAEFIGINILKMQLIDTEVKTNTRATMEKQSELKLLQLKSPGELNQQMILPSQSPAEAARTGLPPTPCDGSHTPNP